MRPVDTFETAESQHIGNHYLNALVPKNKEIEKTVNNEDSVQKKNKTEIGKSVEVISWNRDSMPKVSMVVTERPQQVTEAFELNKDDSIRNHSEEEIDFTTILPNEVTTALPQEIVTVDDSSMFDEVKKSLKDLFGMADEDDIEDKDNDEPASLNDESSTEKGESTTVKDINSQSVTTVAPEDEMSTTITSSDPMGSLVLATSTSRHVSLETEICYRGRCIKTDKKFDSK